MAVNKIFTTSQHIYFGVALCLLVIAETAGLWFLNNYMNIPDGRLEAANWVYQFSIISAILGIFTVSYNAVIIHMKRCLHLLISV